MMRPDELQKKMDAVESLKRAVSNMFRAEAIVSARVCFNGHPAVDLTPDEVAIMRQAIFSHHEDLVAIKAAQLRNSGVDPTTLLEKMSAIPLQHHSEVKP